jgi:hypothetical protein
VAHSRNRAGVSFCAMCVAISVRDASGGHARGKVRAASHAASAASSAVALRTTPGSVAAVADADGRAAPDVVPGAVGVSAGVSVLAGEVSVGAGDAALGSEVTCRT